MLLLTDDWLEMGKPVKMTDFLKTEQALWDQFGIMQAAQESNFKYNNYNDSNFLPIKKKKEHIKGQSNYR